MNTLLTRLATAATLVPALAACHPQAGTGPHADTSSASGFGGAVHARLYAGVTPADVARAQQLVGHLTIKGNAPKTGYARSQFGQAWTDNTTAPGGHNGCDTRNDILNRDMTNKTWRDTHHCVVLTGTLDEPYTGTTVSWTKKKATTVQIDHVVALGNAWTHGAQHLTVTQRTALANDPGNLIAADGPANEAKGDATAAAWMPKNKGAWCSYSTKYVLTVTTYHLWVSQADQQILQRGLATCVA